MGQSEANEGTGAETPEANSLGTVLVVEDDGRVRGIIHHALEKQGFRVLSAYDGTDALRFLASYEGDIHVVVADIRLPGANGLELVRRIREGRGRVEPVYISALPQVDPSLNVLPKPLVMPDLIAAVRLAAARAQAG